MVVPSGYCTSPGAHVEGEHHGQARAADAGAERVGTAGAPRDGRHRPGSQGALLRPRVLRHGVRAAVAPGLADGLPARGDPGGERLRRVPDPRSVGHRGAHPRPRGAGVPERLRHRGVQVAEGRGNCASGFTCPFHGWCYGADGRNTFVSRPRTFSEHNLESGDIDLTPVRCEVWGGCAWINLDDNAPPLRESIEPFATIMDAWKVESLRTEWWYSWRLP